MEDCDFIPRTGEVGWLITEISAVNILPIQPHQIPAFGIISKKVQNHVFVT